MPETSVAEKIARGFNLVIVIGAISGLILGFKQPEFLHVFSIITYFVVLIYIYIYVIRGSNSLSQFSRWIILAIFYIGTILFFVWVGSWLTVSNNMATTAGNFPFQATVYDFENSAIAADITPWFSVPQSKSYKTIFSKEFAHSGRSSLQLFADMQSASKGPATEYAGIGLKTDIPSGIKAIVAWILIPESGPSQNVIFKAHIRSYNTNDDGTAIVVSGEATLVQPGTWMPVFLGKFGETNYAQNQVVWNGRTDEVYLSIWSDQPYRGSIYIDDIALYR